MSASDEPVTLLGVYPTDAGAAAACRAVLDAGLPPERLAIVSEFPYPEGAFPVAEPRVRLQWVTVAAGVTGILAGIGLTVGTAFSYPIRTGHMPVLAMPPYAIISYELMMLFGIVATVIGFSLAVLRSRRRRDWPDEPLLAEGHVGVVTFCRTADEQECVRAAFARDDVAAVHRMQGDQR